MTDGTIKQYFNSSQPKVVQLLFFWDSDSFVISLSDGGMLGTCRKRRNVTAGVNRPLNAEGNCNNKRRQTNVFVQSSSLFKKASSLKESKCESTYARLAHARP